MNTPVVHHEVNVKVPPISVLEEQSSKRDRLGIIECPRSWFDLKDVVPYIINPYRFSYNTRLGFLAQYVKSIIIYGRSVRMPNVINEYRRVFPYLGKRWIQKYEKLRKYEPFNFIVVLDDCVNCHQLCTFTLSIEQDKKVPHEKFPELEKTVRYYKDSDVTFIEESNLHLFPSVCEDGVLLFGEDLPALKHRRMLHTKITTGVLGGFIHDAPIICCQNCGHCMQGRFYKCENCEYELPKMTV